MNNFSYITANSKSATCVEIPNDLNPSQYEKAFETVSAGLALLLRLAKPLEEYSRTEFLYEYRRLVAETEDEDQKKELAKGHKALNPLRSNPELAKRFKSTTMLYVRNYEQTKEITLKDYTITVPDELLDIITLDSTLSISISVTHDGEIQIHMQVSNPTIESDQLDDVVNLGWNFVHVLEKLNQSTDLATLTNPSLSDLKERLGAVLKGEL